jgi:chorismate-pyruvate lyase
MRVLSGVICCLLAVAPALAQAPAWPDTPLARLEAMAVLQSFNADLLSHASATLTLERWCAAHRLAPEGKIVAKLDRSVQKPATDEQRQRLKVGPEEPIIYRRVHLTCGDKVLSEADNWYVPSRLTAEMNRLLTETETPFGRAVLALDFHRNLLSAKLVWDVLPPGWETQTQLPPAGDGTLAIPGTVLEHRAILLTPANMPFSEVVESYTGEILDFLPPRVE